MRSRIPATTFSVLALVIGASASSEAAMTAAAGAFADRLQELVVADATAVPSSPGQAVTVLAPDRGIEASAATGDMTVDRPFRIASIATTFVAAATFRLVEQHRLDLDDDIGTAGVPDALIEMLRADGYDVGATTVHQLLDHTSGIAKYTDEDAEADSPYVQAAMADPQHRWTPGEQVRFAVDHHDPLAHPARNTTTRTPYTSSSVRSSNRRRAKGWPRRYGHSSTSTVSG